MLLIAYGFLIDPSINVEAVVLTGLVLVVAAAAFVLPLRGMHQRLVVEKEGLQLQADRRFRVPTWPWQAATLRAFLSALLVPIVIWLIIRALERFV